MDILYSIYEVLWFVFIVLTGIALIEGYFYYHFKFYDRSWFYPAALLGFPLAGAAGCFALGLVSEPARMFLWLLGSEALIALFFRHIVKGRNKLAYLLLAPAFIGLALLLVYPFIFEIYLSFHDLKLTTIMQWKAAGSLPFVGLRQYVDVFTTSPLSEVTFW